MIAARPTDGTSLALQHGGTSHPESNPARDRLLAMAPTRSWSPIRAHDFPSTGSAPLSALILIPALPAPYNLYRPNSPSLLRARCLQASSHACQLPPTLPYPLESSVLSPLLLPASKPTACACDLTLAILPDPLVIRYPRAACAAHTPRAPASQAYPSALQAI